MSPYYSNYSTHNNIENFRVYRRRPNYGQPIDVPSIPLHPDKYDDHGRYNFQELIVNGHHSFIKTLSLSASFIDDAMLALLEKFTSVETIVFDGIKITGATFNKLPKSVKILDIESCYNITDEGISNLKHLVNLKELNIYENNNITGSGFSTLPTSLTDLTISGCTKVLDVGIGNLQHLIHLESLTIETSEITGVRFNKLPESLETIRFIECENISDENLAMLQHLRSLIELHIEYSQITGSTLDKLPEHLEKLVLNECKNITTKGIYGIIKLKNLKSLISDFKFGFNSDFGRDVRIHLPKLKFG